MPEATVPDEDPHRGRADRLHTRRRRVRRLRRAPGTALESFLANGILTPQFGGELRS